jgi:hypothetical protein
MGERVSELREGGDPIEGLRERADALAQRAAGLKKLADAWQPLYQPSTLTRTVPLSWRSSLLGPCKDQWQWLPVRVEARCFFEHKSGMPPPVAYKPWDRCRSTNVEWYRDGGNIALVPAKRDKDREEVSRSARPVPQGIGTGLKG